MTTETTATEPVQTTPQVKTLESKDLSFSEYQTLRRGGTLEAPVSEPEAKAPEQKQVTAESETAATEEGKDESLERESVTDTAPEEKTEPEEKKAPKKGGIQKRFDKMTAEKAQLAQELEYWKQTALKGKDAPETKAPETQANAAPKTDADKPNPETFATHAEYVEALADWKYEQRSKADREKADRERFQSEQQKIAQTYQEKLQAFKEKTPDFHEVEAELTDALDDARVRIPPAMTQAFLTAENGPELAYELAKDPKEFTRICKLDPVRAAVELGKFAAKLEAKSSAPETKKITNASKPLDPVGSGKGATPKRSLSDPDLPFSDYVKLRRQGKSA